MNEQQREAWERMAEEREKIAAWDAERKAERRKRLSDDIGDAIMDMLFSVARAVLFMVLWNNLLVPWLDAPHLSIWYAMLLELLVIMFT